MSKDIILTGIRSNDTPTLGNYLGAILPMVAMQRKFAGDYQLNMFVPDLHSFTTPINHQGLYENTIRNLKFFAAAGLDIHNPHTYIYRQSYVPAHSEMAWILDCFTYIGELNRMTQFKEKAGNQDVDRALQQLQSYLEDGTDIAIIKEYADAVWNANNQEASATSGLYTYPVLMAADILLYGAKWVPVGEDQRQHLELTRDLAQRLNNKFGEDLLQAPEAWGKQLAFATRDNGVRIRSLTNPEKKMSKSISDPKGTILLTDDPSAAAKKVMSATTDSFGEIKFDLQERPGISNLLQMLAQFTGQPQAKINAEWKGKSSYGDLKKAVAAEAEQFLATFQARLEKVDEIALMAKLEESEEQMRQAAAQTLYRVQQAVGLRPQE